MWQGQLESFVSDARGLGSELKLAYFFFAWLLAKNLCLDPLAMVRPPMISHVGREAGSRGRGVMSV